jgi:hypothetical protein
VVVGKSRPDHHPKHLIANLIQSGNLFEGVVLPMKYKEKEPLSREAAQARVLVVVLGVALVVSLVMPWVME